MDEKKEEVVEEAQFKLNGTSMMLIIFAIFLIGGGFALIATGNNKSLITKEQVNREKYSDVVEEPKTEEPEIVIRNHTPQELTVAKAIELIETEKKQHGDTWTVSVANIKGVNKDNSYLVDIDVVLEDGSVDVLQTIISDLGEGFKVEYPLWHEDERDLSLYGFNPIETKVEEPIVVETPTDVETPVDQVEEVIEPTEEVVVDQEVVDQNEEEVTE